MATALERAMHELNEAINRAGIDLMANGIKDDADLAAFAISYLTANLDHAFEDGYPEEEEDTEEE